ncbi:hypothetical protein H0H92_014401, partial [Tricholoma furcatifolium]
MYGLFKRFNNRIDRFAARYRSAYAALSCLNPSGPWSSRFQNLEPKDISGPGKEDKDGSNGRFELSWIWLVPRLPSEPIGPKIGNEQQLEDSMRIDWAKAMARLSRWEEEVELVQEEMRRVIIGLMGCAEQQANMFDQLAMSSAACWLLVLEKAGLEAVWKEQFVVVSSHEASEAVTDTATSVLEDNQDWIDEDEGGEVDNSEEYITLPLVWAKVQMDSTWNKSNS